MMEALLLPWLATTARPRCWLMAIPCGVVPTRTDLAMNFPKFGLACTIPLTVTVGLRSMMEILLQPVLVTTAMGEKGPLAIWSAMATADGCVLTGFPLVSVQTVDMSTAWITRKSTELD